MTVFFYDDERNINLRALQDLVIRQQIFGSNKVIRVPVNYDRKFWLWYAHSIRFRQECVFKIDDTLEPLEYPEPSKSVALWYSGGVESTYTLHKIKHLNPDLLSIDDYPVFFGTHRNIGQIHFLCAVVGAQLGYKQIYMGVEKNELFLCQNTVAYSFVERDPLFIEYWNSYRPQNKITSVCTNLHKEEIVKYLHEFDIQITGSCDNIANGWCKQCFKCFEAFYSAKVNNIDLGFKLKREAFERFYNQEYLAYIASGFKKNPYNALQYFVRLQISYGLEFDSKQDCE